MAMVPDREWRMPTLIVSSALAPADAKRTEAEKRLKERRLSNSIFLIFIFCCLDSE
jgi:hypothetical protein